MAHPKLCDNGQEPFLSQILGEQRQMLGKTLKCFEIGWVETLVRWRYEMDLTSPFWFYFSMETLVAR